MAAKANAGEPGLGGYRAYDDVHFISNVCLIYLIFMRMYKISSNEHTFSSVHTIGRGCYRVRPFRFGFDIYMVYMRK